MPPNEEPVPTSGLPETIHSSVLVQISGYTDDRRLRQLAQEGILPRPQNANWPTVETLSKLCAYLKRNENSTAEAEEVKERAARRRFIEVKTAKLLKELLPRDVVDRVWGQELGNVKPKFVGMGAKLSPQILAARDAAEIQALIDREVREILGAISENPDYSYDDKADEDEGEDDDANGETNNPPGKVGTTQAS
jgi:hypothetical protein